jgi:plastocyanin
VRRLALATALCTCLLAGCGGDDEGEQGGRTQTVAAGKAVRVVAREYSFDPATVVIKGGGGRVKITLANKGSLAHNLKVEQGERELGGTPTFQSGRTESGTVSLDPGSYTMICTVGNHAELGMRGKLEVER